MEGERGLEALHCCRREKKASWHKRGEILISANTAGKRGKKKELRKKTTSFIRRRLPFLLPRRGNNGKEKES